MNERDMKAFEAEAELMIRKAERQQQERANMETKMAVLTEERAEHGYTKFTMTYPSGKTFERYLSPENANQDHDLRNEMCAWAEERGFEVRLDLEGMIFGD